MLEGGSENKSSSVAKSNATGLPPVGNSSRSALIHRKSRELKSNWNEPYLESSEQNVREASFTQSQLLKSKIEEMRTLSREIKLHSIDVSE